ncbi:ATP-binding cassette domain-containing protein [Brevibacterium sp.]|uniref:ATP-binding cassette domain-containing protein n=1 Tax=Brevibacterium sp. TaxID=1701 RepID=UPI0025BA1EA3|nr:ATP-binding cassette domain-containing protein [Brevibacterium sp.]
MDAAAVLGMTGLTVGEGRRTRLRNVDMDLRAGEVVALVGANGAGTSALIEAASGRRPPAAGRLCVHGEPVSPRDESEALAAGISTVAQHPRIPAPLLTAEALYRHMPEEAMPADRRAAAQQAFAAHGLDFTGAERIGSLSDAEIALVEMVRVAHEGSSVVLLDDVASALSGFDMLLCMDLLRRMAAQGRAVLYATHRLEEVRGLCDRAVILSDGEVRAEVTGADLDRDSLVRRVFGQRLRRRARPLPAEPGEVLLSVTGLGTAGGVRGASFSVRAGEVLGIAGLRGSGAESVIRAAAGREEVTAGTVEAVESSVFVLDDPTRGVDEAGRVAFRRHLQELTASGAAVLLGSPDLTEIIGSCHRVVVFRDGLCCGMFENSALDEDRIVALSAGSRRGEDPRETEEQVRSPAPGRHPSDPAAVHQDWPYGRAVPVALPG